MSDEIRRRLHELREAREVEADFAEGEEAVDPGLGYGQVGLNRRPELMVQLRKKDGNCKALSYGYLISADFNPSQGIVLQFVGCRVRLVGRQLRPLMDRLVGHRVTWVQEEDDLASRERPDGATVVTLIEIVAEN